MKEVIPPKSYPFTKQCQPQDPTFHWAFLQIWQPFLHFWNKILLPTTRRDVDSMGISLEEVMFDLLTICFAILIVLWFDFDFDDSDGDGDGDGDDDDETYPIG